MEAKKVNALESGTKMLDEIPLADQLKLKSYLLKLEMRDKIKNAQTAFYKMNRDVRPIKEAASGIAGDAKITGQLLIDQVAQRYHHMQKHLNQKGE